MDTDAILLELSFTAKVVYWRGPAPFFFVAMPAHNSAAIRDAARSVSYGWGMVPVEAEIAGFGFTTALYPKDGGYLMPLKTKVRERIGADVDDPVDVVLCIRRTS